MGEYCPPDSERFDEGEMDEKKECPDCASTGDEDLIELEEKWEKIRESRTCDCP